MRRSCLSVCSLAVAIVLALAGPARAQHAGARAGYSDTENTIVRLEAKVANSHIMIEGTAQVRVKPTQLRLIWAVTEEASDAVSCREASRRRIEETRTVLRKLGIPDAKIVQDFVSAIPRFEYLIEEQKNETVLAETQTGFRIQTNLHVAVDSDQKALEVIDGAFKSGVSDLIGVDYSADLADAKRHALREAILAAKAKAGLLFAEVCDEVPPIINLQEQTAVFFPEDLYDSFENVARDNVRSGFKDSLRRIDAYRPQNTYYQGLPRSADKKSYELSMKPEIVIESKVVIYYQSPAVSLARTSRDG